MTAQHDTHYKKRAGQGWLWGTIALIGALLLTTVGWHWYGQTAPSNVMTFDEINDPGRMGENIPDEWVGSWVIEVDGVMVGSMGAVVDGEGNLIATCAYTIPMNGGVSSDVRGAAVNGDAPKPPMAERVCTRH